MVDRYEFQVSGRIDQTVRATLTPRVTVLDGPSPTLVADAADQAALMGLIATLESLGLDVVSVDRLPEEPG